MNALPSLGIQLLLGKSSLAGRETHQNNSFVSRVKLVQAVAIPPRGAMFVKAELDGPRPIECEGDVVFEPRTAVLERMGLDAPEALVQLQDDGKIWVCLENMQCLAMRVNTGETIGAITHTVEPNELAQPSAHDCLGVGVQKISSDDDLERLEKLLDLVKPPPSRLTTTESLFLQRLVTEYADVFALNDAELGCTTLVKHDIHTGSNSPYQARDVTYSLCSQKNHL